MSGDEITLRITSGPHAGDIRTAAQVAEAGVTVMAVLLDLVDKGIDWTIDWPDLTPVATANGKLVFDQIVGDWARADLVARIIRAALGGRTIRVLGEVWTFPPDPSTPAFAEMIGALEDTIAAAEDRWLGVVSDDEFGLTLGAAR